jgi:hypothetical protein
MRPLMHVETGDLAKLLVDKPFTQATNVPVTD